MWESVNKIMCKKGFHFWIWRGGYFGKDNYLTCLHCDAVDKRFNSLDVDDTQKYLEGSYILPKEKPFRWPWQKEVK